MECADIIHTQVWFLFVSLSQMTHLRKQRQHDALLESCKPRVQASINFCFCTGLGPYSARAVLKRCFSPISFVIEPLPYIGRCSNVKPWKA